MPAWNFTGHSYQIAEAGFDVRHRQNGRMIVDQLL